MPGIWRVLLSEWIIKWIILVWAAVKVLGPPLISGQEHNKFGLSADFVFIITRNSENQSTGEREEHFIKELRV